MAARPHDPHPSELTVGCICRFRGLRRNSPVNGRHVEIVTPLTQQVLEEADGQLREAARFGIRFVAAQLPAAWARPEHLELVFTAAQVAKHRTTIERQIRRQEEG